MKEMTVTYLDDEQQIKERVAWKINPKLIMLIEPGKLYFLEFNRKVTSSRQITDEIKRSYHLEVTPLVIKSLLSLDSEKQARIKTLKDIQRFVRDFNRLENLPRQRTPGRL